jgi:LacI family transcriptional regulator
MTQSQQGEPKRHRSRRSAKQKMRLADVARRAGVSEATASRAINRPELVRPEVRERVARAIQELSYVAHGAARALASDRTHSIGLIVPTLRTAVFAESAEILQQALNRSGYHLIIASSEYDKAREFHEVRALLQHGIDGMVLVGQDHSPELWQLLERSALPFVTAFQYADESPYPCIGVDNRQEFYDATRFLINLGHTNIGVLTAETASNERLAARVAGARACIADHDLPKPDVVEVPSTLTDARQGLRRLVERNAQITAVACTNDLMAFGALAECRTLGIDVPGQLSVIGFDDLDIAEHTQPSLTTVRLPLAEQSRRVGEYLLARVEGRDAPSSTRLKASFIVRESTGRPPEPARATVQRGSADAGALQTPSSKRRARSAAE